MSIRNNTDRITVFQAPKLRRWGWVGGGWGLWWIQFEEPQQFYGDKRSSPTPPLGHVLSCHFHFAQPQKLGSFGGSKAKKDIFSLICKIYFSEGEGF